MKVAPKYHNVHASVLVFVGSSKGACKNGEMIDSLALALRSPELKQGKSLQAVLDDVIKANPKNETEEECSLIKPQIISTLPDFVDFSNGRSQNDRSACKITFQTYFTAGKKMH
jgi:hypothetical protein